MAFVNVNPAEEREIMDRLYHAPSDLEALKPGTFENMGGGAASGLAEAVGKLSETIYGGLTATPDSDALQQRIRKPTSVAKTLDDLLGTHMEQSAPESAASAHDFTNSFAPNPTTTGVVGRTLNGLVDVGSRFAAGTAVGGPFAGAAVAGVPEYFHTKKELTDQGVRPDVAEKVATQEASFAAAGSLVPAGFGARGLTKILTGAASMEAQGMGQRALASKTLEANGYPEMAAQYKWLDAESMVSDLVLGSFFGGIHAATSRSHLARDPMPSDVDAALAAGNNAHVEINTAPGVPADAATRNAHVASMKKAMDDLANDRPVDVSETATAHNYVPRETSVEGDIIRKALEDAGYHDMADELARLPSEEEAAQGAKPVDRRTDAATRKAVAEMTPAEMRKTLLTHELTGIPNRRAYEESTAKPVQVSIDADSLKWINDNMGHQSGDALLKAVAQTLHEESGGNAYHLGGDEFAVQADSDEHAQDVMYHAIQRLANREITYTRPDGTVYHKKGLEVSYGQGHNFETADENLRASKEQREAAGSRSARGAEPRGVVKVPPAGRETGRAAGEEAGATAAAGDGSHAVDLARQVIAERPDIKLPDDSERVAKTRPAGPKIDASRDIPYAAGMDDQGNKVYVDKDIPQFLTIEGKTVDVHKLIAAHEIAEADHLPSMSYEQAHAEHGIPAEKAAVKAAGISWKAYEKALQPYIDHAARKAAPDVPHDLETKPYTSPGGTAEDKAAAERALASMAANKRLAESETPLTQADKDVQKAEQDAKAYQAAVDCFMRNG